MTQLTITRAMIEEAHCTVEECHLLLKNLIAMYGSGQIWSDLVAYSISFEECVRFKQWDLYYQVVSAAFSLVFSDSYHFKQYLMEVRTTLRSGCNRA